MTEKNIMMTPAGTLMFGRAMLAQLGYELELSVVYNPAVITNEAYSRKAAKAASMISFKGRSLSAGLSVPDDCDCLLLAGGTELVSQYRDDSRIKCWIMLDDEDLKAFTEPLTDFIVADRKFCRDKSTVEDFMRKFAGSISAGTASHPGKLDIPPSFTYSCRTKIISGDQALNSLPELLAPDGKDSGMSRPMVLTDKGIAAVGLFSKLEEVLNGIEYEVFDDIPPDSSSRTVNEISRLYREKDCDGIIALGGGSVLDTGKGVFLNVSLGEDDLALLAGSNRIPELETPFIAIPTTSGTGSEVTKVAVISDAVRNRKILYVSPKLQPEYAILDSRLTASLPPHLSSITGMDALSHAVEAYTCLGKNPVSDQAAWSAVEFIRDNLIPVMSDPGNLDMRRNLALASMLAGQAFSNSMVGMVHTIGHSIGAVCHAPHGSCMAVLLPAALEYNYSEIYPMLAELLPAVAGTAAARSVPAEKKAARTIECIRQMNRELKVLTGGRHPTGLGDIVGRDGEPLIKRSDFRMIAETSLGDASIVYNPVELRIQDILGVLEETY